MCRSTQGESNVSESGTLNQSGVADSEYELDPVCGTASTEMDKVEFLKRAIASQQITVCLQIALAAMLFVLEITVVILSFVSPGLILAENLKTGGILGGTVVAASGFL